MSRHLYSITLQKPTTITQSIVGNFSGEKLQEIVVFRGSYLELFKLDVETGQLSAALSHDCFAIIRSIAPFRLAGTSRDRILITSDSGKMTVVEYNPDKNKFVQLYAEPFGKTGVRRVVPGHHLAVDPLGRACLTASIEKNKLVYVLNRDSESNITIASPLEAHKPHTLVYKIVGMDVDLNNPCFASLEIDYKSPDPQKKLVYYELDLGLNHVIRKWQTVVDRDSNVLIPVLGVRHGPQNLPLGPSGVLVGTKDWVYYHHQGYPVLRVPIPRRKGTDQPVTITYGVMHKFRSEFFFLLQADTGDLFKLTMDFDQENQQLHSMEIKFFQTIPRCNSFNILKKGFLFAAYESGNHDMFQIVGLGDEDDTPAFNSKDYSGEDNKVAYFEWFASDNLSKVSSVHSLHALMGADVSNISSDDTPQIHTISGEGAKSTFRTLKYGLPSKVLTVSPLQANPLAVWTVRKHADDLTDKYIVLAFANSTVVLEVGNQVTQVSDTGIDEHVRTLAIQQVGRDGIIQVHTNGIRHVDGNKKITEWKPAPHEYVLCAASNNYQIAIVLNTNQVVYFEINDDGEWKEFDQRVDVPGGVKCISIGAIPKGRVRASFLALGCNDETIRVLSLDLGSVLEPLLVQALTACPSDILIAYMQSREDGVPVQYLHIGLVSGVYISSVIDPISGQLSDTRTRFLGPQELKLFAVKVGPNSDAVLALSTKVWLGYSTAVSSFDMAPVDVAQIRSATSLTSPQVSNGIIGIEPTSSGSNLHIFTITDLNDKLRQYEVPLRHTPRRMSRAARAPRVYYVIESDNNAIDMGEPLEQAALKGYVRAPGKWSSCIEVVDPSESRVVFREDLQNNEAAFSVTSCIFAETNEEYLIVGGSKDQIMLPRSCESGFLHVYKCRGDYGDKLELFHSTKVEQAPLALAEFKGRLLVGIGNKLRLYDIGKKQLLRKNEIELPITTIATIGVDGDHIAIGDMRESITWVVYKPQDDEFLPFADDTIPRHITCSVLLDYETTMCGDRFGNIFMLKVPEEAMKVADEDAHGVFLRNEVPTLNAASAHRLDLETHFYVGDTITSLCKASLVTGGSEAVIYSGLQGTIGAMIPIISKSDAQFFQTLEQLIREDKDQQSLVGRDHLIYRGYYAPVKGVIDGDLCERFSQLPLSTQEYIASELGDRTVRDVERKIADMRIRSVF